MRCLAASCAALAMAALSGCAVSDGTPPADSGFETDFEACAERREEAELVPVNLLLTVDRSGSMDDGDPVSKWTQVIEAVGGFLRDEGARDLSVALRIWPDPDGCNSDACDAVACSQPQVPTAPLSDEEHRAEVIRALERTEPEGETPLSEVVAGAALWGIERSAREPNEAYAVALVTDGEPNGCIEDISDLETSARTVAAAGVPLFAVGIEGSNADDMARLAAAGQTGQPYLVGETDVAQGLLDALLDIRGQVLSCTFEIPEGEGLDLDLVRVEAVVDGESTVIPRLSPTDECDGGGWFFDAYGQIVLCPDSCAFVQGGEQVALEIAVGCECESTEDCPDAQVCEDNVCLPDPVEETLTPGNVQGGALNCTTTSAAPSSLGWLIGLLLGAGLVRRQRIHR